MENHIFVLGRNKFAKRTIKAISIARTAFHRNQILLRYADEPVVIVQLDENKKLAFMPGLGENLIVFRAPEGSTEKPTFNSHAHALEEAKSIAEEIKLTHTNMLNALDGMKKRKDILLHELNENNIKLQQAEQEMDDVNHRVYTGLIGWADAEIAFIDNQLQLHEG